MNVKPKIALVVSHPIQHFCPQYVSFAENKNIEFKVYFASRIGLEKYVDLNFNHEISWGNLNLDKFEHEFLNGDSVLQSDKNIDAPTLEESLSTYGPDVLITYGYFQKLQRRAYRWAKNNKVPIAYISDSERRHKHNRFKNLVKYPFLRKYFSGIQYFLTVGNANEEFYQAHAVPSHKMLRMHFPIDLVNYKEAWENREELRRKIRLQYNIPQQAIVLSVVGKLVAWKNQDHIISAMQLLEKKGIYLYLFIIGSGEKMQLWKDKASVLQKSKVYFTGFVPIEELPAYYSTTDIYVHPASLEPHSIAISEAIYMGCPVLVSSHCGSYGETDDVQPDKNGYVFSFGNTEEIGGLIKLLINDPDKRKTFGTYSHEIATGFQEQAHFGILEKLRNTIKAG